MQIAEPNKYREYAYDAKGNLTLDSVVDTTDTTGALKFAATRTDSTRAKTYWTYDAQSLATAIRQTLGEKAIGKGGLETGRWTPAYNATGDVATITDVPTGAIARGTQYDAHGRLVTETDPLGTRTVAYTPTGLLLSETFASNSAVPGYTLTATHNSAGLITELNTGTGFVYRWTYDANHKITSLTLNGATLTASSSKGAYELLTRLAALLTLSRDVKAQTTAPTLAPGGGLRGPGWIGVAGLIFQIGRNIMNQQQAADSEEKTKDCDPCKDPSKQPKWKHIRKHTVPPHLNWADVRAQTGVGRDPAAKYKPELTRTYAAHEAFEQSIWANGKVIKNTNSSVWKVKRITGVIVGAASGADASCAIVKCSGGEIHGYPAPESECDKPAVPYP